MSLFTEFQPSRESYWRSIILFGGNTASYKFALAKSLLEVADAEKTRVTLEELAVPFSRHICEHLKHSDRQTTSASSTFLESCKNYNSGEISYDSLLKNTVSLGFKYVLDAFPRVNGGDIPLSFYHVENENRNKVIIITDELLRLKESFQFTNLSSETEARWRLVETAWKLNISSNLLSVSYDSLNELLFVQRDVDRTNITSCRDALNGYQKGKCFYCFSDISIDPSSLELADVDHFFPHTLLQLSRDINIDGVWNLVLACKNCNRGMGGKFAKVPRVKYLERLHRRNNFLIDSHHPLRETLMLQTGSTGEQRENFLSERYRYALSTLIHTWQPMFENEQAF